MITIKDEREIDLMRHAGHVVGLVHQELAKWLKPGLTTEQVSDFCEKIIRKNGCTPSFLNLYNFPGAVCTSVNDVVVHGIPNGYVLKDGDIISVDVGACWKGYHGDSAWTFAIGNVSPQAKHLMEVCEQSLYAGLEQVKPTEFLIFHMLFRLTLKVMAAQRLETIQDMALAQRFMKILAFLTGVNQAEDQN